MKRANTAGPRRSVKIATAATALGLVGLGTGVSLASTRDPNGVQQARAAQQAGGAANAAPVTCITQADPNAQANAFTAVTDLFPPGTNLHVTSGLSAADVVVSGALNANNGNANAGNGNGNANNGNANNGNANNGNANNGNANNGGNNKRKARRNRGNNANAGNPNADNANAGNNAGNANAGNANAGNANAGNANAGNANAGNANAGNANANAGNATNNRRVRRNRDNNANAGNNANGNANAGNNANGNTNAGNNNGNAGNNDGVDPNSVCVELSKAPFDKLSDNGNGQNVNTFVVTMTPLAGGNAGRRQ